MLEKELRQLGLSEKEVQVYLACLQLGKASVQEISQKSGVNRATTYIQLETLLDLGLVSALDKDKKNMIMAEQPERIIKILQKRKEKIDSLQDSFLKMMPQLQAIYNLKSEKPMVKYYEKDAGLDMWREEMMKANPALIYNLASTSITKGFESRRKNYEKNVLPKMPYVKFVWAGPTNIPNFYYPYKKLESRFFPMASYDLDIIIYSNNVFLNKPVDTDASAGVLIQDKVFYESFKAMFEFFWQMGQPLLDYKIPE